jgi:hypothetical protein
MGVIMLNETQNVQDYLNNTMAPYDERIEVDEYTRPCWCVGRLAKKEVEEKVTAKFGDIQVERDAFWTRHNAKDPDEDGHEKAWKEEVMDKRNTLTDELFEKHPGKNTPDPKCKDCWGTGLERSTYNPKSKWDWWVIGGRWCGRIQGKQIDDKDGGFNFGDEYHREEENIAIVSDVLKIDFIPFGLITPDGEWHEKGEMGWFGAVSGKMDTWEDEAKEIFASYPDHKVVLLDCHI